MTAATPIHVLSITGSDDRKRLLRALLTSMPGVSLDEQASNEAEALQKLGANNVDVVLLDLGVRDLDGIELTRKIRESHPSVKVVITTGSNMPADIFAAMDAGADAYVLQGNLSKSLESAIRSVRLNAVWLDPAIAKQVLEAMMTEPTTSSTRTLPTGLLVMPLMPHEKELLHEVASSNCADGICMVDPDFVKKLKRYAPVA